MSPSYFWEITLAWALSVSTAFGWLWMARWLMRRNGIVGPLVWQTFTAFIVAFILRAGVFDYVVFKTGASQAPEIYYRLSASLPTFGFGLLICAYIVSLARDFSRNIRHISALNSELAELNRTAIDRVAAHRTELISYIQSTLRKELASAIGAAPESVISRMRDTIEQVVRPVSRQLVVSIPDFAAPTPPSGLHIAWSSVFRNILVANPLRPFWFALWVSSAAWSISITRNSLTETFGFVLLVFATSWAIMAIVSLGWSAMSQYSAPARAVFVSGAGLIVGLSVNLVVRWLSPVSSFQSQAMFAYALISLGIVWFIATVTSLRRATISSSETVDVAERELRETQVFINTRLREQRLAISKALHGPVQDRIMASVFKLVGSEHAVGRNDELVPELVRSIEQVIDQMSSVEPKSANVDRALSDLSQLWAGVVSIRSDINEEVLQSLRVHPASSHTVIEVIREACANAIRHGEASNIFVDIVQGERPQTLRVNVKNDGKPLIQSEQFGVGSLLMEEITLEWSRVSQSGETSLSALIPLVD